MIQKGHTAAVKAVAVSPDGKYVLTASRDRSIKLWDMETQAEMRTFVGHSHTVNSLAWSADGKFFVSGSADNTAKVWEVISGKEVFTTPAFEKYVTAVSFTPSNKHILVAGYSDSAAIFNILSGEILKKIPVNADQGSGYGINLTYSNDGKWLAIGEDNKTVSVYKTDNYALVHSLKPAEGWCGGCGTLVAFSPDNSKIIKLSHNDSAHVYDLVSGKEIATFAGETDKIQGLSFNIDGKKILLAADNKITEWSSSDYKLINSFKIDSATGDANDVVYNQDATLIFAACNNFVTSIYNAKSGKTTAELSGVLNKVDKGGINYSADNYWDSYIAKYIRLKNLVLLTADDKYFITGKTGKNAVKWNINSGKPATIFSNHEKAVICFDLSADGKKLITGDGAGNATLWDFESGKKLKTIKAHREPIFEIKFSPDNENFTTSSWDGSIIIWNLNTGKQESYMDLNNQSAYTFAYSPDGLYLVTSKLDKTLELREPDSKSVVRTFIGHTDVVASIQFGPEKYKMLSASWDGTARIWDISTGIMLQKFKGHEGAIYSAIYTNDGKKIITAGEDRIIRIWDVASGKVLQKLTGHQAEITSIKISKDGKLLISYSLDGAIKCWNLEKNMEFYEHIHFSESDWMAHTSDGYFNATNGARDAIHFIKGMEVYDPNQFFEEFYRPDLVPELFKNRGADSKMMNMNQMLNMSPPPTVKMYAKISDDGKEAELNIKIIDNGGGVSALKIFHNGKVLPFSTENIQFPAKKDEFVIVKHLVSLVNGYNSFAASAISKGRVESAQAKTELFADKANHKVVCHLMAIGIDKYKNPSLTLTYAREDAEAFVQSVKEKSSSLYASLQIHTLYDEAATKQHILDTLQAIANHASSNDVFIFYYAGHGSMVDNKFYFITTDCARLFDQDEVGKKALSDAEVQEKMKHIKALKQIIIMDACQSGGSVELLASRGSNEEKALAQLSRSAGIHVLASAGGEQNAKEIAELKHGLFTYVLLEALNGKADGAPKDGKITIYELKSYLDDQVPELNAQYNGKLQFPYTFSRGQDFPVVKE